jgi:Dolichyl-phosphate-mannose-protein mannosyltransferase
MQQLADDNKNLKLVPLQIIFVLAIFQFIISFLTEPMMLTFDESMWQYIGRNWIRNGLVPYSGGVDNKSPLIFLVFGISDKLFGVNYWFPRIVGIAVQSAGIYGLFKIAERMMNRRAGLVAISFYGLSLLWHSTGGKYVSYTETYAVTCIILAVYYCIVYQKNSHAYIGGLLAGLGFGFRFSAVFGIIPVFIFIFKRNRLAALTFVLGILTSIIALILLAEWSGIKLNEFIFYGFSDNFGAGSATAHSTAWKMQRFADSFFYSELILFYPAVVFYFFINRKLDFFKTWLFSEFIGIIILGMYDRSHFKDLLPVMSLMSAFAVYFLMINYNAPLKKILLGLWIVFFPKSFEPLLAVRKFLALKSNQDLTGKNEAAFEGENLKRLVGLWIRSKTIASDKVFVAGYGAQIQAYSERESPSIYFNVTQTPYAKKRLFDDLSSNKPTLMVIPLTSSYTSVVDADVQLFERNFVSKNYTLDTCIHDYNIFRYIRILKP